MRSRTSLAAATGEIIDNDAARRVNQVDLENMMTATCAATEAETKDTK